uniref:Si:dkey-264d12.4 n=1 Tax=Oryzias sinensis TaxID=183150 RepID=A0A8C7Y719_9TELE
MVCLLVFIIVLHLLSLAMLLIATLEKSWWIWADSEITDLWYNCLHDNTTDSWLCAATTESGNSTDVADWLQSVQALMVLSVVFSSVSLLVFLGQLFTLTRGSLFYFTALSSFHDVMAKACLWSIKIDLSRGRFGYCFVLAWLCVPLLLVTGVLYIHLRKKQ